VDGSGARELYEAARAIDPDQPAPRAGLARVAEAALAQAADAVAQERFAEAHSLLQLARELSIPRERADALAERLRTREAALAGVDGLAARAGEALAAGRLHGDEDAALALYARVLELAPDHAEALRGRDDALAALLEQARADLRGGELQAAAAAIAAARGYDAGHVDLPETEARLVEELDALRSRAGAELARGRIEAAASLWQRLQRYDPEDASARDGLARAAAGRGLPLRRRRRQHGAGARTGAGSGRAVRRRGRGRTLAPAPRPVAGRTRRRSRPAHTRTAAPGRRGRSARRPAHAAGRERL